MRVAYFTESLYPLVDGVSRTLARLFATLETRGVEFQVFSPFLPGPEVSWRNRVEEIPYIRFPPYPDYRVSLPSLRRVRAAFHPPPDLVHVVSPTPMAFRAKRHAMALGIPVVASFHTHFVSYFRYYGIGRLEKFGWAMLRAFYDGCARVYAPSPSIISELVSHGIQGVELWSRGIDLEAFSPSRRDINAYPAGSSRDRAPILLLVSRLVKEKDLSDLVTVDRILRARGVRFSLALVGDGPMRGTLEKALPEAHFLGHRSGLELARFYASADVFVFPSTTETLGNVVLEALASGLPAVVVDRGGPQDLIQDGVNGFVARSNDPERIADALQPLLEDEGRRARFSAAARQSSLSRDWEVINGALLDSYSEVIAASRSNRASPTDDRR